MSVPEFIYLWFIIDIANISKNVASTGAMISKNKLARMWKEPVMT